MKRILFFLILFFSLCELNAQFRMAVDTSNVVWTTINDSTYSASLILFSDLTGKGYIGTDIVDTFRVFTDQEQVYRIDQIASQGISSIELTVVEYQEDYGVPQGQLIIYDPIGRTTVPQAPFATNGGFPRLNAAIDTWNAKQDTIDAQTVSNIAQDTVLRYINPPDVNGYFAVWDSVNNQINWVEEVIPPNDSIFFSNDFLGTGSSTDPIKLNDKGAVAGEVMTWDGTEWTPQAKGNGIYGGSDTLSANTTVNLNDFTLSFDATNNTINDSLFFFFENNNNVAGFASDVNDEIYLKIDRIENTQGNSIFSYDNSVINIGDQTQSSIFNFDTLFLNFANPPAPSAESLFLSWDETTSEVYPAPITDILEPKGWLKDSLEAGDVFIDANNNSLIIDRLSSLNVGVNNSSTSPISNINFMMGENITLNGTDFSVYSGSNINAENSLYATVIGSSNVNIINDNQNISVIGADSVFIDNSFATLVTGKNHLVEDVSTGMVIGDKGKPYDNNFFTRGAGLLPSDNALGFNQVNENVYIRRWQALSEGNNIATINVPINNSINKAITITATLILTVEVVGDGTYSSAGESISFTVKKVFTDFNGSRVGGTNIVYDRVTIPASGSGFGGTALDIISSGNNFIFRVFEGDAIGVSNPSTFKGLLDVKIQETTFN